MNNPSNFEQAVATIEQLKKNLGESIFGQTDLVNEALTTLLSSGHLLITGAPGLAKTTLVRVIARFLSLQFGRIQFTPDLLPSDVTGSEVLNLDNISGKRVFEFLPGPIFTNLLLADEINRASPRTQSALLEAMQEKNVTINGKRNPLPRPFMVFGTQNPFESEGTFPLPEAQLDRFLLHSLVQYPDSATELAILNAHNQKTLVGESQEIMSNTLEPRAIQLDHLNQLIEMSKNIEADQSALEVINFIVRSTRPDDELCPKETKNHLVFGAGPRGGLALLSAAKSFALISGHSSVKWSHVERMILPALRHRCRLSNLAGRDGQNIDKIILSLSARAKEFFLDRARGFF